MQMTAKHAHSEYTEDFKDQYVLEYYASSNMKQAAEKMGVPYETAKSWCRAEWFKQKLSAIQVASNKKIDKELTKIIEAGFAEMQDRIVNGEERVTKDGSVIKVKTNLSALTIAVGTMFDKRQLVRKEPTTIATSEDALMKLADKLRGAIAAPAVGEVIDVEVTEITEVVDAEDLI